MGRECERPAEKAKEAAAGDRTDKQDAKADKERRDGNDEQVAANRQEYPEPETLEDD